MKYTFAFAIIGAAIILGGCSAPASKDATTTTTTTTAPATTPAATPAATDAAATPAAGDAKKFFSATVVNDSKDDSDTVKTTFAKDTAEIFVHTKFDISAATKLKGVWICDKSTDNATVAPNTKIDEKTLDVAPPINVANFSLTKPTAGWPLGDYHVDLYNGDTKVDSVTFKIA